MRYHSLLVAADSIPPCLEVSARTAEGEVMGLRHRTFPIEGIQFHPESIGTPEGKRLLANFLADGRGVSELHDAFTAVLDGRSLDAARAERVMGEIFEGDRCRGVGRRLPGGAQAQA